MDNYLKTLIATLGEALQQDSAVVEYNAAREAYGNDTEITGAVNEYNVQRMLLDEQRAAAEPDEVLLKSMEERIQVLYEKIMAAESMKELARCENNLNALLNEVNAEIMSYIIPQSDSCSGDCHSCGGCH